MKCDHTDNNVQCIGTLHQNDLNFNPVTMMIPTTHVNVVQHNNNNKGTSSMMPGLLTDHEVVIGTTSIILNADQLSMMNCKMQNLIDYQSQAINLADSPGIVSPSSTCSSPDNNGWVAASGTAGGAAASPTSLGAEDNTRTTTVCPVTSNVDYNCSSDAGMSPDYWNSSSTTTMEARCWSSNTDKRGPPFGKIVNRRQKNRINNGLGSLDHSPVRAAYSSSDEIKILPGLLTPPGTKSEDEKQTLQQLRARHRRGRPRTDELATLIIQGSTSPSSIKCSFCQRVFPREKSLQAHERTHRGDRPYMCDYPNCTKSFAQTGQLNTHQRLHTGEKPFICSETGCEIRFTHSNRHCPDHPNSTLIRSAHPVLQPISDNLSPEIKAWLERHRSKDEKTPNKNKRPKKEIKAEQENHFDCNQRSYYENDSQDESPVNKNRRTLKSRKTLEMGAIVESNNCLIDDCQHYESQLSSQDDSQDDESSTILHSEDEESISIRHQDENHNESCLIIKSEDNVPVMDSRTYQLPVTPIRRRRSNETDDEEENSPTSSSIESEQTTVNSSYRLSLTSTPVSRPQAEYKHSLPGKKRWLCQITQRDAQVESQRQPLAQPIKWDSNGCVDQMSEEVHISTQWSLSRSQRFSCNVDSMENETNYNPNAVKVVKNFNVNCPEDVAVPPHHEEVSDEKLNNVAPLPVPVELNQSIQSGNEMRASVLRHVGKVTQEKICEYIAPTVNNNDSINNCKILNSNFDQIENINACVQVFDQNFQEKQITSCLMREESEGTRLAAMALLDLIPKSSNFSQDI